MKAFRVTITVNDPYPKEKVYVEHATYYDYAQKKAHIKFRKEMRGKRLNDVRTHCQDLGKVPAEIPGLADYLPEQAETAREVGVTRPRTKVPVSRDPAMAFLNEAMRQIG